MANIRTLKNYLCECLNGLEKVLSEDNSSAKEIGKQITYARMAAMRYQNELQAFMEDFGESDVLRKEMTQAAYIITVMDECRNRLRGDVSKYISDLKFDN